MSRKLYQPSACSTPRHVLDAQQRLSDRMNAAYNEFERRLVETLAVAEESVKAPGAGRTVEPIDPRANLDPLRPTRLDDMIGQDKLKPLLRRLVDNGNMTHLLFVGASGTGKTTIASIIARELGTRIYQLKAPVDMGMLDLLRQSAQDGDVVFVDEIHQQVSGDRRGITQACDPESFYMLLEDGVLATATGPLPFPRVTWIGATTDVGLLPEPLINRFPIRPQLAAYTDDDMVLLAQRSLGALGLDFDGDVCSLFGRASRNNPRQLNDYIKAAQALSGGSHISTELAREVVTDLCSTTLDGLTPSMQSVLKFLYLNARRETRHGVQHIASVGRLATAAGHGRDTKAINLLVEPYLIQRGLLDVLPTGRALTHKGIERAQLLTEVIRHG